MILDKRYYERKPMKSKEVEDVLGGADSWKNVDKTESQSFIPASQPPTQTQRPGMACERKRKRDMAVVFLVLVQFVLTLCPVNCKEEKCDNREAYFRQVQIRSADEPMTTFYKVYNNHASTTLGKTREIH